MPERRMTPRPPHDTDTRTRAYGEIRDIAKDRVMAYYHRHPEHISDPRGQEGQEVMLSILRGIFQVLDNYKIIKRGSDEE